MRRFLAFFDKRTVVAFLTALTLLLVSCDVSGIGYEKYINEPFFARASGVVDGMEVEAEIYYSFRSNIYVTNSF